MVFASKFSVGLPNFLLAGLAAHAEQFVIILFGCSWHSCDSLAESEGRYAELKASPSARLVPTIRIARATALRGAGAALHQGGRPWPFPSDWPARSSDQSRPPSAPPWRHQNETEASGC